MPGPPAPKEAREERLQARGYGTRSASVAHRFDGKGLGLRPNSSGVRFPRVKASGARAAATSNPLWAMTRCLCCCLRGLLLPSQPSNALGHYQAVDASLEPAELAASSSAGSELVASSAGLEPVPPPMQPDEQAEPLVAGSAAEPVLLTLPDELLRAVGQEAWSPLVPAASAALARACRGPFLTG